MNNRYYFILSNKCNMDCKFCYEKDKKLLIESDLDVLLNKEHLDHLVLIGGEPLLNMSKLKEVIQSVHHKVNEITIVTNGLLINNDLINFINIYSNVYLQISVYSSSHLDKLKLLNHTRVLYHILITEHNIKDMSEIMYTVTNYNVNRIWISIDRYITKNISNDIKALFRAGLINKDMFRDIGHVGKKCGVMTGTNKVINGDKELDDCLSRVSSGTKMVIDNKCLSCNNIYCDACICNDMVASRDTLCEIFNTIREEIENEFRD
ncbi:MAG: radical SAM protein [Peptostreptococcaceae bacterium]